MKLLSVSLPRHDASISYFDGKIVRYIKLERTHQIKHHRLANRWEWLYEIKKQWNLDINDVDEIVFDFHVNSFYDEINWPEKMGDVFSGKSNYIQLDNNMNIFKDVLPKNFPKEKLWYISHHYAHSLSTWMMTETKPNLCFVVDGEGDFRTWSVFRDDVLISRGFKEHGSIGGSYMRAADRLGITSPNISDNSGKLMGLQSYGTVDQQFLNLIRNFGIREINKIFGYQSWLSYKKDETIARNTLLDWTRTIQEYGGELLLNHFSQFIKEDDVVNYSGGVAQNVLWNTIIKKHYPNIIIPPHCGDEGLSLGGIEFLRIKNNLPPFQIKNFPYCQDDIKPSQEPTEETIKFAAKMLSEGKTVGWYQGNGELGPRALGNRSILMDPRIPNGKFKINQIKKRETYRPFGASVLKEHKSKYFDMTFDDDYMLHSTKVHDPIVFDSISHVDGTCRVQTVGETNKTFRKLLEEFYNITGCAVVLNTSLNMAGKPLAAYPEVAKDFFDTTELDCMIVGDEIMLKTSNRINLNTNSLVW